MIRYESGALAPADASADALYELGIDCASGRSAPADLVSAHKWFNLAAMKGHAEAARMRREIASRDDGWRDRAGATRGARLAQEPAAAGSAGGPATPRRRLIRRMRIVRPRRGSPSRCARRHPASRLPSSDETGAWSGTTGQSSRPSSQRQSGTRRSATKVGRPSAPARCAFIESDATIRSRLATSAAVSRNASSPVSAASSTCSIRARERHRPRSARRPGASAARSSGYPAISASGAKAASGIERPLSCTKVGLPCHEMPTLKPGPSRARHAATRCRSGAR